MSYAQAAPVVTPTPGGAAGDGSVQGAITLQANQSSLASKVYIRVGSSGAAILQTDGASSTSLTSPNGVLILGNGNLTINSNGTFAKYENFNLAGQGFPPIFAAGAQTLNTNVAPTTLSYTPPATAGTYVLKARLNVKTAGTMTFKAKVTYTDAGGTAQSDIPDFFQQNSATLLVGGPAANSTGRFWFRMDIDIDNSATPITIADNAGTYTAGTYYWIPRITQEV